MKEIWKICPWIISLPKKFESEEGERGKGK